MSIFVQIAAYRDPELVPTIQDMLANAKYPKKLTVCICNQYHPDDSFNLKLKLIKWLLKLLKKSNQKRK